MIMSIKKLGNQHGSSLVVVLLAVIILVLIVGLGIHVNKDQKQDEPETAKVTKTETKAVSTKDWKTYQDPAGFFEFKYPQTWSLAVNINQFYPGLVQLGDNT